MSSSSFADPHFNGYSFRDFDPLKHRPHKTALHLFNAISATAVFRIWPHLLFIGGWSAMVVLVNHKTKADLTIPSTMITVLGVLLGLTLSYRTSSAYEKYSEGRKMWSQIILASRNWARALWYHCPDTILPLDQPPSDPQAKAEDIAHAVVEKKTIIQLALAFAVAVKHYLRGEEGIDYEDLYYLVNFIPGLDLPSGIPTEYANIAAGLPMLANRPPPQRSDTGDTTMTKIESPSTGRQLRPAEDPPQFRLSDLLPTALVNLLKSPTRKRREAAERAHVASQHAGAGHNVPLEITMFMSTWVSTMQRRKTIDIATVNALLAPLTQLADAQASLERILTTPIPWSYNAHIWEVSWIYCLALPFQLYDTGFGWVTIPAVVIVTYIVFGYASIAEEIENPFNFDKNDLNLGHFCREIIARELDAITAQPVVDPAVWIFSPANFPLGPREPSAAQMVHAPVDEIRARFKLAKGKDRMDGVVQV